MRSAICIAEAYYVHSANHNLLVCFEFVYGRLTEERDVLFLSQSNLYYLEYKARIKKDVYNRSQRLKSLSPLIRYLWHLFNQSSGETKKTKIKPPLFWVLKTPETQELAITFCGKTNCMTHDKEENVWKTQLFLKYWSDFAIFTPNSLFPFIKIEKKPTFAWQTQLWKKMILFFLRRLVAWVLFLKYFFGGRCVTHFCGHRYH